MKGTKDSSFQHENCSHSPLRSSARGDFVVDKNVSPEVLFQSLYRH